MYSAVLPSFLMVFFLWKIYLMISAIFLQCFVGCLIFWIFCRFWIFCDWLIGKFRGEDANISCDMTALNLPVSINGKWKGECMRMFIFINTEMHWSRGRGSMNSVHSLTDCRIVNLIDVTLACEDAYSKLAEHSFEHFFIRPRSDHWVCLSLTD